MSRNTANLQSDIIRFLRFPLILGVLYRHAQMSKIIVQGQNLAIDESFFYLDLLQRALSDLFGGIRVPIFFFIAGMLFFRNYTTPSSAFYKKQWRKRVDSLLIPYVFWNSALILFYLIAQSTPLLNGLFSGRFTQITAYGWKDFLDAFGITTYRPVSFHFWFVRDLMFVSLLTPFIAFSLRKAGLWPIFVCFCLWIFQPALHAESLCFFSLGAYFSIKGVNVLEFCRKYRILFSILFVGYNLLYLIFPESSIIDYVVYLSIPAGIFFVFDLCGGLLSKYKVHNNWFILSDMSFFLFAIHEPFLSFLKKVLYLVFRPQSEGMLILIFLLPPLFITACAWYCYRYLVPYLHPYIKQAMGIRPSPVSTINREAVEKSPKLSTQS